MSKRQLMTSADAVVAKKQHEKPCSDCPWARTAVSGWLGDMTKEEWAIAAHGEARIDCHTLLGAQCAGAAIYRANVCKSPRDKSLLMLPADRETVFARRGEFYEHHSKAPERPSTQHSSKGEEA